MKRTGLADSPLFPASPSQPTRPPLLPLESSATTQSSSHKKSTAPKPMQPADLSQYYASIVEEVRRAVRPFGKQATTHRLTPEEKKGLARAALTYQSRGLRTSANEIARVAINFVLADYRRKRRRSILHRALQAIHT